MQQFREKNLFIHESLSFQNTSNPLIVVMVYMKITEVNNTAMLLLLVTVTRLD